MFEISAITTERIFEHDGIPVIRLTVATPVITGGKKRAAQRINAFYGHVADAAEKYIGKKLQRRAAADFTAALENSRPFEPYRVKLTFEASEDGEMLDIRRRMYTRTRGGTENEKILTELWSTRLGLPEKLGTARCDYVSSSEITEIS